MRLSSLELREFRNITDLTIEPDPEGTTVITGKNGAGKTGVLEAIAYLSTLQSFRHSPKEALVKQGSDRAILRATTVVEDRSMTIEAEIISSGRSRTLVNRQAVKRRSDLHQALRTTVFSPEDIGVVREGPAERRRFLDETLTVVDPKAARTADEVEKVVRQRTALLRRCGRRLQGETAQTLDVWDARLDEAGTTLVEARTDLVEALSPLVAEHYSRLAGRATTIGLVYRRSWAGRLLDALANARTGDVERGVTSVGPHRDELDLSIAGLAGRTHASQGEQRSLALALRLAAHELATTRIGTPPVLLLDDVFSELDPFRTAALLEGLPPGQTLLTTALPAPSTVPVSKIYPLDEGNLALAEAAPR